MLYPLMVYDAGGSATTQVRRLLSMVTTDCAKRDKKKLKQHKPTKKKGNDSQVERKEKQQMCHHQCVSMVLTANQDHKDFLNFYLVFLCSLGRPG